LTGLTADRDLTKKIIVCLFRVLIQTNVHISERQWSLLHGLYLPRLSW